MNVLKANDYEGFSHFGSTRWQLNSLLSHGLELRSYPIQKAITEACTNKIIQGLLLWDEI